MNNKIDWDKVDEQVLRMDLASPSLSPKDLTLLFNMISELVPMAKAAESAPAAVYVAFAEEAVKEGSPCATVEGALESLRPYVEPKDRVTVYVNPVRGLHGSIVGWTSTLEFSFSADSGFVECAPSALRSALRTL